MKTYTFENITVSFVKKASFYVARHYAPWGMDQEEAASEMTLWLFDKGNKNVHRWLKSSPQQTTRIYRSLVDVGRAHGEKLKAARVGYDPSDVMWYSPAMVSDTLILLALDPTFTGTAPDGADSGVRAKSVPQEGGNLMALVLDVRRALKAAPPWVHEAVADGDMGERWDAAIQCIVNWLGGEAPAVGKRKVISNATANHITGEGY